MNICICFECCNIFLGITLISNRITSWLTWSSSHILFKFLLLYYILQVEDSQVKEEDVLTEIAGVFDDSTLLADQLIEAQFSQEELNQLVKEEVVSDSILLPKNTSAPAMQDDEDLQYLNILQNEASTICENSALRKSNTERINIEDVDIKPEELDWPVPSKEPLKGIHKSYFPFLFSYVFKIPCLIPFHNEYRFVYAFIFHICRPENLSKL